ncbi:FKBP-type peptidyl-prolyl cis-trans isomerase [Photobacterium carnosum]|uniref:Peptidyl-prolyl cis-trans isomerase n=1 Tax=Photobacterium carnosum TaxID=2023717 RepID=A0A2N4UUF8_9GAMM|nr:FKBP-type peptidyl-prolyl cis-trans isomerase [Photobacterium carnosum]MCD9545053.1 FKBP-type peptidyl-prolyl cis-trans isomerase [Photobacterium carnosum]MCF2153625.1 FKBP-type peptidyl-prolyl cis-trans isomerase [Photobacterium carnosum]MCF2215503.1 FKBP-type peptidyl-prolyl cis-trans isomerase [Photobacterium carnosum]PLC58615.1 FKBP-type peptidyl-prolyl cis-trans isomerase FkpA [Photobacterium carnosum]
MKPILKMSVLAATIFLAVGCQDDNKADTNKPVEPAKVEQTTTSAAVATTDAAKVQFKTEDQKAAYAIGASLAQYLSANLDQQKELGLNLNRQDVLAGVEDVFAGKSRMTQEQTQQALQSLDQRVAKIVEQKAKAEAEKNIKAGEDFRATFAKEAGVVTTKSGLMYKVEKEGTGAKPAATDTVEVQYKGMLTNGTVFDSSYQRNQPATFPLNQVIPGWTEGVQLMPVGSKFEFVIPPQLAYGAQANPSIPANSTLVFQVELLSIKDGKQTQQPAVEAVKTTTTATKIQ